MIVFVVDIPYEELLRLSFREEGHASRSIQSGVIRRMGRFCAKTIRSNVGGARGFISQWNALYGISRCVSLVLNVLQAKLQTSGEPPVSSRE